MPGANPLAMNRKELEVEVAYLRSMLEQKTKQLLEEREGFADSMNELVARNNQLALQVTEKIAWYRKPLRPVDGEIYGTPSKEETPYVRYDDRPIIPPTARKWGDFTLWLLTPDDLRGLPEGSIVVDIVGCPSVKTVDWKDYETRMGYTAYGFLQEIEECLTTP